MTITLDKTWIVTMVEGTSYATTMYGIKATLDNYGWSVSRSSDSVSAGASDYWLSSANLIWATGNRSWIVLRNDAINTGGQGFQVCIDLSNATKTNCTVVVSPNAGFTGGAINARPTATDELVILSNTRYINDTTYSLRIHISSDYECTRIFAFSSGTHVTSWYFEKPKSPPAAISIPWFAAIKSQSSATNEITAARYAAIPGPFKSLINSVASDVTCAYLGYNKTDFWYQSSVYGDSQDYFGDWVLFPVVLVSTTASPPSQVILGLMFDAYWNREINTAQSGTYTVASGSMYGLVSRGIMAFGNHDAPTPPGG
jgi:hypothetical protein